MVRGLFYTLVVLLFPLFSQVLSAQVKNKVIITLRSDHGYSKPARLGDALSQIDDEVDITSVDYLFPELCQIPSDSNFCNQYAVTVVPALTTKFLSRLMTLKVRRVNRVFRYKEQSEGSTLGYDTIDAARAVFNANYSEHIPITIRAHARDVLLRRVIKVTRGSEQHKPHTEAILRGTDYTGNGVGFFESIPGENGCTAVEIGQRCLLTARHCENSMGGYSHDKEIKDSSKFVSFVRHKVMSGDDPDDDLLVGAATDLAIAYTGSYACSRRSVHVDRRCSERNNGIGKFIWSAKTIASEPYTAWKYGAQNPSTGKTMYQTFTGVGYSNADIAPVTKSRSGKFTITDITNAAKQSFDSVSTRSTGSYVLNVVNVNKGVIVGSGDSGGPLFSTTNGVVGIVSAGVMSSDHDTPHLAFYTGLFGEPRKWIRNNVHKVCRKEPNASIKLKSAYSSISLPMGFTIVMNSTPEAPYFDSTDLEFVGETRCGPAQYPQCWRKFANLTVSLVVQPNSTASAEGWRFDHWEASLPGVNPCECVKNPQSSVCSIRYSQITDDMEFLTQNCTMVLAKPTPSPTPTRTPTRTPTKTATPSPSSTATRTPTVTPTRSPIATATPTQIATRTPIPTSTPTQFTSACPIPGWIQCNGICTDPTTDPNNCMRCGNVCAMGVMCRNGTCGLLNPS